MSSSRISASSSSTASSDSLSLPVGPMPRLTPPGSPQDTFGGHNSVDLSTPLSPTPLSPLSQRPTSLATTATGTGSRTSPHTGADPLPPTGSLTAAASGSGSRLSFSTTATSTGPSSSGPSGTSPAHTPATGAASLPASGSFGPTATPSLAAALASAAVRERELRERPLSLGSVVESEVSMYSYSASYSAQSPLSPRSSWLNPSPSASSAAIVIARKLRVSGAPSLPPLSPSAGAGYAQSTSAVGSTLAVESSTLGPRSSTSAVGGAGASSPGAGIATSSSSSSLQPPSAMYSPGAPLSSPTSSLFSRRSRASYARPRPRPQSPDEPLPSPLGATSFASTTFPSMSPRATPTDFNNTRDLPQLPGELPLPHYSFLDEDPALGSMDSPSSVRGGVSQFSGSGSNNRASSQSVPVSEPAARLKHLSAQSGFSDASTGNNGAASQASAPAAAPSRPTGGMLARWSLFAGGPPVAWGRRDSVRSVRSTKSNKSTKSKKRSSKHASMVSSRGHVGEEVVNNDDDWEKDDESVDLSVLVRRAAILERLLRAGKRASNVANAKRISAISTSTHYSGVTSKQSAYGRSNGLSGSRSTSGHPEKSTSNSQRRSAQSVGSSVRQKIANRLGFGPTHPFSGLGSDDGDTGTSMSHSTGEDFVDLGSSDFTSQSSHYLAPPGTPPRRAVSTSISRPDYELAMHPSQGSGVIVFPELATMPPLEPINKDGEVCAQSCLPASVAVPYTPLKPPPPTAKMHASRSLHSLRNLRFIDEKHTFQLGSWSNTSGPTRHSQHSSMLIGDVPSCDEREVGAAQRRLKILLIVASIIVVALIAGLLGGLLTRRNRGLAGS